MPYPDRLLADDEEVVRHLHPHWLTVFWPVVWLLFRAGILARRGRDIGLARITDVSYRQTLWERLVNSGTVTIESAGEGGATVLEHIPDSDGVQQLLNHMIEEDADRRAQESAGYVGEYYADGPRSGRSTGPVEGW